MRRAEKFSLVIVVLFFIVAIVYYPAMPDSMASSWSSDGGAGGYLPRSVGVFLFPVIAAILFLAFRYVPIIDIFKFASRRSRRIYNRFFVMILVFFFYVYTLTLLWNLGLMFDILRLMLPAVGVLFYHIAILMDFAEQDWLIGIRTPWTLASKKVWNQTHKVGAGLFKVLTYAAILGMFSPVLSIYLIVIPFIAVVLFLVGYSYAIHLCTR